MCRTFATAPRRRPCGGRICAAVAASAAFALIAPPAAAQIELPPGFQAVPLTPIFNRPVAMAFAPDGRIFIAQQTGIVSVVQQGAIVSTFIDLTAEVNAQFDRGLLGIALDPNFHKNHYVYLLYTVDPDEVEPDQSGQIGTFARLTRYTGTSASLGGVADPSSRLVLIGAIPSTGFPACWTSHTIGALRFGLDGSLLISNGEGARFDTTDSGGFTNSCFGPGLFPPAEDIGAFRAQSLDSLGGKILRVDPATGHGLPDNPFWNDLPASNRARIWATGLRNPYRFAVRPGTGAGGAAPGTIYIGDVGYNAHEEINVVHGGENFGWPCFEGAAQPAGYPDARPASYGCDTIGTPTNPGPLTPPLLRWHHSNPALSFPPGAYIGRAVTAGVFHHGGLNYRAPWRGAFFFADFSYGWIKAVKTGPGDELIDVIDFAEDAGGPVDFAIDPHTGEVAYLSLFTGRAYRIHPLFVPADLNQDGAVNVNDLLILIGAWGPCPAPPASPCLEDINGDGSVDVNELLEILGSWG